MADHDVPSAVREVLDISPSYYAIADFNGRLTFTNHALNKCCKTQYGDNHDLKHVDDLELVSFYLHKRLFWSDIVDACSQDSITLQVSIGENSGVYKFSAGIIEGKLSKCILLCFAEITPRNELEVQLLEKNGFMDQFLNELPQMICSFDEKGLIRFWNKLKSFSLINFESPSIFDILLNDKSSDCRFSRQSRFSIFSIILLSSFRVVSSLKSYMFSIFRISNN